MNCRTDLALEKHELLNGEKCEGVTVTKKEKNSAVITEIEIFGDEASKKLGKEKGKYITVDLPEFSHESELLDGRLAALAESVAELLPDKTENVLVVGLGNENITPDALGPLCAKQIFATRHITKETASEMGLGKLKSVSAISTGVLGQTGIETAEYIKGIADLIKPDAVIIIDALASRSLARLGKTVQLSNVGITPGAGVGNFRMRVDESVLNAPVISMGVPTVVDGATIVYDLTDGNTKNCEIAERADIMMVTPRDIDTIIERAARLLALSINCALQPNVDAETFLALA